jgi:hypothetical protein
MTNKTIKFARRPTSQRDKGYPKASARVVAFAASMLPRQSCRLNSSRDPKLGRSPILQSNSVSTPETCHGSQRFHTWRYVSSDKGTNTGAPGRTAGSMSAAARCSTSHDDRCLLWSLHFAPAARHAAAHASKDSH